MGVKVQARVESALQAPAKVAPAQPACIDREAVWERMNVHGISQNEAARRAGLSSAYLSQIMSGKSNPSPGVLKKFHGVLFQRSKAEERVMPAEVKVLGWKKGKRRGIVVCGAGGPGHKDGGGTVRVGGQELAQDETQGFGSPVSSWSDAERFEELQKKYFGDKVLPSNGAEFIREAREARDAQLEGIA